MLSANIPRAICCERFPFCAVDRRLIKTLNLQQNRTEKRDDEDQPVIIRQRINLLRGRNRNVAVQPNGVGHEHREGEQQCIDHLKDLRV